MVSAASQIHVGFLVCLSLFSPILLPGSDAAFTFTKTPPNPTVAVLDHNSSRVALSWEYAVSGGEQIGQMRIQRLKSNGAPESVASKFNPSSSGIIDNKFNKDGHFEFKDPATLVINSVTEADELEYRCVVQTSLKPDGYINATILKAYIPANITVMPEDQAVFEKENFTFYCDASGKPDPVITWFNNGNVVGSGSYYTNVANQSGTYECKADNGVGQPATASATLTVKVYVLANLTMKPYNKTLKVKENTPLYLSCNASANPEPTWTWFKDDKEIKKETKIGPSVLKIDAVETSDAGRYTCRAKNRKGEKSVNKDIIVIEKSGKTFAVGVLFKITSEQWNKMYEDHQSQEFKTLSEKIVTELWIVYREKFVSVVNIEIFKLSEGSVVAHVRITFDENVLEDDVLSVLKNVKDGKLGAFTFDRSSVKSISPVDPASCIPNPCEHDGECTQGKCSCKFPWKGETCDNPVIIIVLAVVIPLVVLGLVFLLLFWRNKKRKCRKDTRVNTDGDSVVSYAKGGPPHPEQEGEYAVAQKSKGASARPDDQYENVGHRGRVKNEQPPAYTAVQKSGRNNEASDQYAMVDKRNKKKKPAEKELNYAEVSGAPLLGGLPPMKPRRQETTYADIDFRKPDDML